MISAGDDKQEAGLGGLSFRVWGLGGLSFRVWGLGGLSFRV